MKKILLLFIAIGFSYFAKAQEVPQIQSSLIIKRTATWCPSCGGWGWDLFEQLIQDNDEKAILWAEHPSGDLQSATSQGIDANLTGDGQPRFYLNNVDQAGTSVTIRNAIKTGVLQNADFFPTANAIPTNITIDNNQISLTVKSKFFVQAEGEYYLNVYVVENGVINEQAGRGTYAVHEKVLRDDMAGEAFGVLLAQGTVPANIPFSTDFTIPIANDWDVNHIELSTVIWKKVGLKYEFVNGTETKNILTSTQAPILKTANISVSPNPVSTQATISLDFAELFAGKVVLYDVAGQYIQDLVVAPTGLVGHHTVVLDATSLKNGVYWVQLVGDAGVLSQKIVVIR